MIRVAAEVFAKDTATYLDKVEKGEEVWIEKDGQVIARLTRPDNEDQRVESIVESFRRLREGVTLGGLSIKDLVNEGRP